MYSVSLISITRYTVPGGGYIAKGHTLYTSTTESRENWLSRISYMMRIASHLTIPFALATQCPNEPEEIQFYAN